MKTEHEQLRLGVTTTLDEPVKVTIMRDMKQVAEKLKVVLLPLGQGHHESVLEKLREWDLWGPLLVCLLLSMTLGIKSDQESASMVFAAVFVVIWFGAAAVTVNAQLLGGNISFFQSVCILGYCVFPLTLSAMGCLIFGYLFGSALIKIACRFGWVHMVYQSKRCLHGAGHKRKKEATRCIPCVHVLHFPGVDDPGPVEACVDIFVSSVSM